jgi:hypothetical protein
LFVLLRYITTYDALSLLVVIFWKLGNLR